MGKASSKVLGKASSKMIENLTEMDESSFEGPWKAIGKGLGGQVFKARHRQWKKDVAVKIIGLEDGVCIKENLVREYELMLRAESPYVVKVLGVFRGCTPHCPGFISVGVVTDLMERETLYKLQRKRELQPLPWPLVFRLVHQVALGMNHLHSLTPAIIHHDLKPDTILLDSDLNVKIGGFFQAARLADNVKSSLFETFFTPPESLKDSPTCAVDVYSYAIAVWTILNPDYFVGWGEKSYPVRPSLVDVSRMKAPGLEELVDLMVKCWNQDPDQRPTFAECTAVTGALYWKYGWSGINDAVRTVQQELDGDLVPGAASGPRPDPGQDQPAPDPKKVNNDLIQNLMDENNWKVMNKNSFEENWKVIGSGGGGQVFKARHRQWEKDVAIKLLGRDDGSHSEEDLVREAKAMLLAETPYIVKVLGVFNGSTPHSDMISVGLVMDLMESGSLYSLQKKRQCQPLPWPLVFRLVHQVALGMNGLHSLKPAALIHKDLKTDNILLDSDLNVKITDFGISKFINTVTTKPLQGSCTAFYSPPETKQGGATTAYDVYSYAIVVWTILNPGYIIGKAEQSYPVRPSLEEVNKMEAPGLEELVDLMVRCWNEDRDQRPTFAECTDVTERLYEKNRRGIDDAVRTVQQELVKKA